MWNIIFYEREDGSAPVLEFLDGLPPKHRAKAVWEIELLGEAGTHLTMPHTRHIEGKLWELRIKFASDISRIFYFLTTGDNIILLHGFIKKTQKTPVREIKTAQLHLADYERRQRYDL